MSNLVPAAPHLPQAERSAFTGDPAPVCTVCGKPRDAPRDAGARPAEVRDATPVRAGC
jgi:hypothetical protein